MISRSREICKYFIERGFLKRVDAKNLQYSTQTFIDSMNLIKTGSQKVNAECDADLGAHGVFVRAKKRFDAQVLLNPLKEEFNLPAALVDCGNGKSGKIEVICKEDQPFFQNPYQQK